LVLSVRVVYWLWQLLAKGFSYREPERHFQSSNSPFELSNFDFEHFLGYSCKRHIEFWGVEFFFTDDLQQRLA